MGNKLNPAYRQRMSQRFQLYICPHCGRRGKKVPHVKCQKIADTINNIQQKLGIALERPQLTRLRELSPSKRDDWKTSNWMIFDEDLESLGLVAIEKTGEYPFTVSYSELTELGTAVLAIT